MRADEDVSSRSGTRYEPTEEGAWCRHCGDVEDGHDGGQCRSELERWDRRHGYGLQR